MYKYIFVFCLLELLELKYGAIKRVNHKVATTTCCTESAQYEILYTDIVCSLITSKNINNSKKIHSL